MHKSLLLCASLLPCIAFGNTVKVEAPKFVEYQGIVKATEQKNLEGLYNIEVTYRDKGEQKELAKEQFNKVHISQGHFDIKLGSGQFKDGTSKGDFLSLQQVFAVNTEVHMQFSFDGKEYAPSVSILPAGHSLQSNMVLAGLAKANDGKNHNAKYYSIGNVTSIEAAVLSPTSVDRVITKNRKRVFTLPMQGPILSRPLRELPVISGPVPVFEDSEVNPPRYEMLFDKNGDRFGTKAPKKDDLLAIRSMTAPTGDPTPAPIITFPGVGNVNGVLPPDTEGTVGKDYYVQMVNLAFAIFDKSGNIVAGPSNTNTLWSGFGGACQNDNSGDAIALYDQTADRWVLTQFAVSSAQAVCFAVSQTNDPTGSYYLYRLDTQRFPDYFKLGTWPDAQNNAYFMGTNSGQQGQYDVYAMDRENMLAGLPARTSQFFQSYPNLLMPADFNGSILPPAGSPGLLYTIRDGGESYFGNPATDSIDVYAFDIDWDTPANTTLGITKSFIPPEIAEFNWTVCGFFQSDCLNQPDSTVNLDSGSWWPMQRFQYRNFGDHEVLLGTWTVDALASGDHAAPRWFEFNRTSGLTGTWTVAQEGTLAPDEAHRWEPSIAMDGSENIAIGYSVVREDNANPANNINPSIRYAMHMKGDPAGSMRSEAEIKAGSGAQTSSSNRWGDYSSMDIDPADDCTFWYTSEYIETTGSAPWQTYIGAFRSPSCLSILIPQSSKTMCTTAGQADFDFTLSDGFVGTTNLTSSGCPTGANCSFSVNPITAPANASTLQVGSLAAVNAGEYDIVITGTDSVDSNITRDTQVKLNLFDATPEIVTTQSPIGGVYQPSLSPTLIWNTSLQAQDYLVELDDNADFSSPVFSSVATGLSAQPDAPLASETCYYWRVSASNVCGAAASSTTASFYTGNVTTSADLQSTDVPQAIGTVPVTITSDLLVSGVGVLSDVNVSNLVGTHTYMSDLTFTLTSPQGTTVTLMSGSCGSNDNFDIDFDDEAAPGAWPCPPTDGGSYQPASPLSAFDGENADGTWVLTVVDGANQDGGSLDGWGLIFQNTTDTGLSCESASALPFADGFEELVK
ncbi:MAG: proprotein convertase P-domain-containing protein [bacterium]